MCGICGFIRYERQVDEDDRQIITRMNGKLLHRGPDAQDVELFENVALGFSRLSIIGLDNGMQPIYNEDRSLVLICNGEIFNYLELRQKLIAKGHIFNTSSDVEVILHLYEEQGMSFLQELNGQFAFALYDKNKRTLFCVRDPMGIIPFFYTFADNTFIFGSEIKAILQHPCAPREIDLTGLDQVFTFAGLISPRTMFRRISSLENGHFLVVGERGDITDHEYWDLLYPEEKDQPPAKPEKYYVDRLEELLDASIRLRLRADVPTGFYLSGGLDSSMIAMKIHQLAPDSRKKAFSIDFVDSELSESFFQKLIAKESNASLHQKVFFYNDISERLQQSVYHSECPIKETYNTASLSLSESVRDEGIKVILSGEGADEFFAGYVGYRFDKMRAMNLVTSQMSPGEEQVREKVWGDPAFFYERDFTGFEPVRKALYSKDVRSCFAQIDCLNHPIVNVERLRNRNIVHKRAYIDYKTRLVDHLVSDHGDRMALANSVEVRYPFMDKDLVEFSTQVPPELKLKDFTEKYILRQMAGRFMPSCVFEREKFNFIAPGSPYLLQRNIPYINDLLSYDVIKKQGIFDPDRVEELKNTYRQKGFTINVPYESDLLITVITCGILQNAYFA